MKQFNGIDHKKERLYIHWDITTKCNFDCEYCYAKYNYGSDWQKENKRTTIDIILNSLRLSSLPIFLGLLGGEPTESEHYFYILDYVSKNILPRNKDNRLYITTNLSRDLEFWKEHPKLDNTFMLLSFHPQFNKTEKKVIEFIEKVKYLKKYFKVKINIMLDPKFEDINRLWLKYLPEIKQLGIIIHPHIIYPNGSPFNDLKDIYNNELIENPFYKEIYKFMEPEYILKTNDTEETLTDIDVFTSGRNTFKGWKCYQNNYEITYSKNSAIVHNMCSDKTTNLILRPMFFKKLKKVEAVTCTSNYCNCDGLLKCEKIKQDA